MGALEIGQTVDRYRIDAVLGQGGMGEVYRAYDTRLRRDVALKVVRVDADSSGDPSHTEAQRARLVREARSAAALKHSSIVTIYDVGELGEMPYIAMELVVGTSLRAFLRAEDVAMDRKLRWLCDAASALAAAHRARLVHRDVKPDNVMVCEDDSIKVLDFGIAKIHGEGGPRSAPMSASGVPSQRTATGAVIGTPRYMSPEQSDGRLIDARSDQFSWGIVAFELLTGFHPRDLRPGFSVRGGWSESAPSLDGVELSGGVAAAILRTLERDPSARFQSMEDVVLVLSPFVSRPVRAVSATPPRPRPATVNREAETRASPPTLGLAPSPQDTNETPAPSAKPVTSPASLRSWLFGVMFAVGAAAAAVSFGHKTRAPAANPAVVASSSSETPPEPAPSAPTTSNEMPVIPSSAPSASTDVAIRPHAAPVASEKPRPKVRLGMRVLTRSPYPDSAVLDSLAPALRAIETCLQAAHATEEDLRTSATLAVSYGGFAPTVSTNCRAELMCKCMRGNVPSTLRLQPVPDLGGFSVAVFPIL